MMGLTQRQQEAFTYIKGYAAETGIAPSLRELCAHLGTTSLSTANRLLNGLEERGAIRRLPYRSRAIEIVEQPQAEKVEVRSNLWPALVRYAIAERITIETAVNQFIRDGLESS
jgi:repressor LexA